jgi:hypothetical protein
MTHKASARLAGFTFLAYIATGILSMVLFSRAAAGANVAARLANIAQHATTVRFVAVLTLLTFFEAVVLGVTLWALTRDEDPDVAVLALCCRAGEGVLGAAAALRTMELLSVAIAGTTTMDGAAATAIGASILSQDGSSTVIAATCFAVGSTLFAYLFLRARSIPVALAWLGVLASVLLVVALPVRLAGFLPGSLVWPIWMPMLAFEVTLALWLIGKGVKLPVPDPSRSLR